MADSHVPSSEGKREGRREISKSVRGQITNGDPGKPVEEDVARWGEVSNLGIVPRWAMG